MFGRSKTMWRQLLHRPQLDISGASDDDSKERRLSTRHQAQVETSFKPAGTLVNTQLSGRIRNISQGGINLLAKQSFEPGDMLTIELPSTEQTGHKQVLACVVHCASNGKEEWSIGCTFSRELSNDDLRTFEKMYERHDQDDQRESKRFTCNLATTYQLVATDDQTPYQAQVLNLSATGIGLLVDRPIETGALLSVDLVKSDGEVAKTMLACVVHVSRQPQGASALGCNFIRSLGEEELNAIL